MEMMDLVFTLAFMKLGGAFFLGLYLRVQAVRALTETEQEARGFQGEQALGKA